MNALHELQESHRVLALFNFSYIHLFTVFGCWEYNNRYNVLSENGDVLLSAKEESECWQRAFCANGRAFSMPLIDPQVCLTFCVIDMYCLIFSNITNISTEFNCIFTNSFSVWGNSDTIWTPIEIMLLLLSMLLSFADAGIYQIGNDN